MRRAPTRGEGRLWSWLRNRQCSGFKFRRQTPIGPYIIDFYCAELQLAIELDGGHHNAPWMNEYDGRRSRDLQHHGIRVLRIPNELLIRDSLLVEEQIRAVIAEITGSPSSAFGTFSPASGGEGSR